MRLFIGFTPPATVLERLNGWTAQLRAAFPFRWLESPAIHLTLHFLGEVDSARQQALIAALDPFCSGRNAFPVRIDRLGCFERGGAVSIVWAGIQDEPLLTELQRRLGRLLQDLGLAIEDRAFTPHITLARPRADAAAVRPSELTPFLDSRPPLECRLDHLSLFSSRLTPGGAVHCKLKECRLV